MKLKETKKLAVLVAAVAFAAGCSKSDNGNMTATEGTGTSPATTETTTVPPAAPPPDTMLVEQTTVAVIDTNGVAGGSNSLSGSSSTDVGNAAGSDFGSASDRSNPTSQTYTNSTDTNSVSSGTDQKQSSAFATPASDENSGAAASSESGQDSSKAPASQSDRLIDYHVLDATGKPVGTVEALWDDSNGDPRYLAIKGKEGDEVMVIPTVQAQKSQQRQALRVPYTAEVLMTAPKFSREADLDRDAELKVIAFYKAHPPQRLQSGSSSGQASQSATGQQASTSADQQASANKNAADFSDAERRDAATIRLREEQLKIGKKQVDAGGILLKKVVRTETVNQPVQLKREEFVIQRIPGSGEPVQNAQLGEREVFIPLTREEPVVQKDVVLKEVVKVGKQEENDQQQVNAKVREEQLQIIRQGDAKEAAGAPSSSTSGTDSQQNGARSQSQQTTPNGDSTQKAPDRQGGDSSK